MSVPTNSYGEKVVVLHTDNMPRCYRCNALLAELASRPWRIICRRCKARNQSGIAHENDT